MKELGGYIEIARNEKPMLYDDAIKLNCARNAFEYIVRARKIKKIWMPEFMCDSCNRILLKNHVQVQTYNIGMDFFPVIKKTDEWVLVVNYYGQLTNQCIESIGNNIIVDNTQAYFQAPIIGIDTFYSCRKYFGVPDGAVLYTSSKLEENIPQDYSSDRMHFLMARFEGAASDYYEEYVANNQRFEGEELKKMSPLTENLLRGINYESVKSRRTENYRYLHERLGTINGLSISVPQGPFMYPFWHEEGARIKRELIARKIYVPTLWPNVLRNCKEGTIEYKMANNIVPLPVDQRYTVEDMKYLIAVIKTIV